MINLVPNADQKLKKMMFEKSVRSDYYSTCESYTNDWSQRFAKDLQSLITDLAIMMTKVSTTPAKISYCAQGIPYLCSRVLDNAALADTFKYLGINKKANKGKHSIDNIVIDMDRCVTTFNNIVNSIASKYNLFSLKNMVVKKNAKKQDNAPEVKATVNIGKSSAPVAKTSAPKTQKPTSSPIIKVNSDKHAPKKIGRPDEVATTSDEKLKLKAELVRGDGRYKKGIIRKTSMVNFLITIDIDNPNNLKISTVIAYFKCGNNSCEKKLSTANHSTTEIDLETSKFSGNIEASVVVIYKLGMFKTKQIKSTVSKNF